MNTKRLLGFASVLLAIVIVVFVGARLMQSESDGIEVGKDYPLAATYKVVLDETGETGRVFDFADRNLPCPSILTLNQDSRGLPLVVLDRSMPLSTIRKVAGHVDEKVIEGVRYPAYDYVQWRYNITTVEMQTITPRVIARNGRC